MKRATQDDRLAYLLTLHAVCSDGLSRTVLFSVGSPLVGC